MSDLRDFFTNERGITQETLDKFGVKFTPQGETAHFSYKTGDRYRTTEDDGRRVFKWDKGAKATLFDSPTPAGDSVFLVEGETDTMRLWQELGGKYAVYGLPGINTWKPELAGILQRAQHVYVILDNDPDYNVQAQVDAAWKAIRTDLGPKARRIHLPQDAKDVCEFFDSYNKETFKTLITRRPLLGRFKGLDLTAPPPPMRWLVDGIICQEDVTLVMGDPGLGKSWLTMNLAKAVADGDPLFLGKPLLAHGPVLYLDEENPQDVIFHRFAKLGLSEKGAKNITYLHRQGIWLDKDADDLLDEALAIKPTLIVIDALARVHQGDENSASNMASLFRSAITPLARETGAAVLVIHHSNKGDDGNSFRRARGSGDISASVDAALDVRATSVPGTFTVSLYKSRRALGGTVIPVRIEDRPGGKVELVATTYKMPEDLGF